MTIREYNARQGFKSIQEYCCKCRGCSPKQCIFAYEVKDGKFKGDYACLFQTAPINVTLPGGKKNNDISI